jgi:hypothetical protein
MKENSFYVYLHIDPTYSCIKYVGIGQYDRAWCVRRNQRKEKHVSWIEGLFKQGFTLADIVVIERNKLTKKEALCLERILIKDLKPEFNELLNSDHWRRNRQHSREIAEFAKNIYDCGYGYLYTAYLMGANKGEKHMTIKRMINNVS